MTLDRPRSRVHGQPARGHDPPCTPAALWSAVRRAAARPLRFAAVGGLCGLLQIALLVALMWLGVDALPANIVAYLLSAQLNFYLSDLFIWHDRHVRRTIEHLARRWLGFHASIAGTFVFNQAIFVVVRHFIPDAAAAAAGISMAALVNFIIQDRLTFAS